VAAPDTPVDRPAVRPLRVANLRDLDASGRLVVTVAGREILILRLGADIVAIANRCPHSGLMRLHHGALRGRSLECPAHRWRFNLGTGRVDTAWWRPTTAAQRRVHLEQFRVYLEGHDVVLEA
jgi:nitrite reductase/ring-hydroxylating ferredoxin subunit